MRTIVELTRVTELGLGIVPKCLLLHMADTARNDLLFWRSNLNTSKRLGTDAKTVRRNICNLRSQGLISWVGERLTDASPVAVYRIEVDAILALPCIEENDRRAEFAKDLVRGSEPVGVGFRTLGTGVESPTNQSHPVEIHNLAEKQETRSNVTQYARVDDDFDHLENDKKFASFVADERAREHG